jgi:lipopolysaccharide export system permease protein
MKKIDKLILGAFLGPFFLTFMVVVFILLNIHMLKYFDDIIGKDLGWNIIGTLLFYFAIFNTPASLPLAVLLSSLIAFGNLGEHFELTAVKSLGISLTRALVPIFGFVMLVTVFAFYTGNYLVPKAALEAYSLLYDIKQKKPALDLREGAFTSSIPDISIKVNDKLSDNQTLLGIIIYDHRGKSGNKEVIVADSGKMYTILNDQYMKLELFRGYKYGEGGGQREISGRSDATDTMNKTYFSRSVMIFDLSSFGMIRTEKKWFQGNRIMRNLAELKVDMDSLNYEVDKQLIYLYDTKESFFRYFEKIDSMPLNSKLLATKKRTDSIARAKADSGGPRPMRRFRLLTPLSDKTRRISDSLVDAHPPSRSDYSFALATARNASSQLININSHIDDYEADYRIHQVQWHKILASAVACMAMFLIGAPLGAIIKKGGLGIPVLASIFFFILYYVLSLMGEKWGKNEVVSVPVGMWIANVVLFAVGGIFLLQARRDARLFEADFYHVIWDKSLKFLTKARSASPKTSATQA